MKVGEIQDHVLMDRKAKMQATGGLQSTEAQFVADDLSDLTDDFLRSLPPKKKKQNRRRMKVDTDAGPANDIICESRTLVQAGEDDYTYGELLERLVKNMKEKHPEMMELLASKERRVGVRPQVLRAGTRKTAFVNFFDVCREMHRQPKHFLSFISTELGCHASVDSRNVLILRGRHNERHISTVLRNYIREYVLCSECHSTRTMMLREQRMTFQVCEVCGCRRTLAAIKVGYQAVTERRCTTKARCQ